MNKPTWIFVAGTYRTGSTTQYRMTRDIVETAKRGIGIGYHTEDKLKEYDKTDNEFVVCKVFEPLWIGFRGNPSYAKRFFDEGRVKALVTIRDPRDIITSMKKREEGRNKKGNESEWDYKEVVTQNFPVWLGNLEKWIDLGEDLCLVSRFEVMTLNLFRECKRINEFLQMGLDEDALKGIAKNHTVAAIQRYKEKCKAQGIKEDSENRDDKERLPSVPGIAFGTSGQWKTWLSGPEIKMLEDTNKAFMERFGYL